MTFRDDSDALLARNDALERENAELRERCDKLEAELVEARKPPVKPPRPRKERNERLSPEQILGRKIVYVGAAVLTIAGVVAASIYAACDGDDAPRRQVASPTKAREAPAWNDRDQRWQSLHMLLHCRRNGVNRLGTTEVLNDTVYDPRSAERNYGEWLSNLTANGCADELARATRDRTLPAEARAALKAWHDADLALAPLARELGMYYYHRDFVDDDLAKARAQWPILMQLVRANQAALAEVARVADPAIRADLLATLGKRKARDEAYWRGTLHLALHELNEALYLEPADPARVQAAAASFRSQAADAPVEVRRRARPAIEALDALGAPGEGDPATIDLVSLRTPVFNAIYEVAPSAYPSATL